MSPAPTHEGHSVADFDPRLTFETLVVGPANRLASAAARRAAESPGASYNPLFLYSASGLGKSHILHAIAHHALRTQASRVVVYETLEGYLDHLTETLEAGGSGSALDRYARVEILLLDDVQFLTGQAQAQEMLLRTLDTLTVRGAQVVLASDRPPAEINGLDARLLSRFSGGLIVDIGLPDYETRVAIMRRKMEERSTRLADGVPELLARYPFQNVRELQGALNRLLAIQELEDRVVPMEELGAVLGEQFAAILQAARGGRGVDGGAEGGVQTPGSHAPGFGAPPPPDEPEWRRTFRQVVEAVGSAGYSTDRIERQMVAADQSGTEPREWRESLQAFRRDIDRLREIRSQLQGLPAPWPADADVVLRDPDLLDEAERLLGLAVERSRPFPPLPAGPPLQGTGARFPTLARRAAERAMTADVPEYNPLFLHALSGDRTRDFLAACGRSYLEQNPDARVGLLSVPEFSEEFIGALSAGVAGAWRERWWSLDLLLLHEVEGLGGTERAQEEFFHLFEALKRKGARLFLAADRSAFRLEGIDDRLRSRFQGGLVLDLGPEPAGFRAGAPELPASQGGTGAMGTTGTPVAPGAPGMPASAGGPRPSSRPGEPPRLPSAPERAPAPGVSEVDPVDLAATLASLHASGDRRTPGGEGESGVEEAAVWELPQDRVVWRWHRIEDRIVEESL